MNGRISTPTRRTVLAGIGSTALAAAGVAGAQETTTDGEETTTGDETTTARGEAATFEFRLQNVSPDDAITPSDGEPQPVVLSPGVYVVHTAREPVFTTDERDRREGLEALAEDGDPEDLAESLRGSEGVSQVGVFDAPLEGDPGPAGPDQTYGFSADAAPGEAFSFVSMFVPSNDLFFAPAPTGIPFFQGGRPIAGGLTDRVSLWDAGTEVNEEPGVGPNQVQNQDAPDTGPDEDAPVRRIENVDDGFDYPSVSDVLRLLVVPTGGTADATTDGATGGETATGAETTTE